ncbi:hypothetical protein D1007_57372 [Hordeum vulgare]|nr:hypothetical protein D1007_57372 [Hordeum vulgare]
MTPTFRGSMPLSAHLEYYCEQVSRFELAESDEEEVEMNPESQCLSDDVITVVGSVKRSLFENLEKEAKNKKKLNTRTKTWGPIIANRPKTRNHGDVKIMNKACAYKQKKNLEIPSNFKGKSFANIAPIIIAALINKMDLCIGKNDVEQAKIIQDMIYEEIIIFLQFVDDNPETVLPDNLELGETNL